MTPLAIVCTFTFLIHLSESVAYCLRLSGLRVRQIAIALSFVTSTLLVSRLSNMVQAPFLGIIVDRSVMDGTVYLLESQFRLVIFAAFLGALAGAFLAPTVIVLFEKAILRFNAHGSVPRIVLASLKPKNAINIFKTIQLPKWREMKTMSLKSLPKQFLILNVLVTAVYTIGVLCSLLAGAYLPELRATAIQLSGIVNGIATILLTIFVDPAGARITDQAMNGLRPESDVRSVVFFLQMGKIVGTLIVAQLLLHPLTLYIVWVTKWIATIPN